LLQQAQKTINPNAVIPEIDAVAPVNKELAEIRKELADDRAARQKEKADAEAESRKQAFANQWAAGQARMRSAGYTKEGLDALEKFMEERGIADHEIAAAAFERINPPAPPVDSTPVGFDAISAVASTNEQIKKLIETRGQDRHATGSLVKQALSEVRTAR
ncbi:MAG: hypothetical protein KGJ13_11610, partial [Patescibacteria group bacterium]|nr:hypothetical protein [Patescibacteria group bacterium]